MPDWLQILLAIGSPIITIIGTAFVFGQQTATMKSAIEANAEAAKANARAIEHLALVTVSKTEGQGYQAQLDRLERRDAECEGKLVATRQEFSDRIERHGVQLNHAEKNRTAEASAIAGVLGRLDARVESVQKSVDGLVEADRAKVAAPAQQGNSLVDALQTFATISKLMRDMAPAPAGAH